ncbi:hypothetical protein IIV6-T1_415 [Invertebrate iridescent virus 6]|nr:hypothetical protein IIV6-T1_415 [Invertebrate iridescent virus 6]
MLENPHLKIYNLALELLISILMHRLLFFNFNAILALKFNT